MTEGPTQAAGPLPEADPLCILIVDDSRAMRGILRRQVGEAGFCEARVLEAADGAEALALARRHRAQIVLADFNMPGMDGLELLAALRAEPKPPFFALVSAEGAQLRARAELEGADLVLSKPVCTDALRQALGHLGNRGRPRVPCAQDVAGLLSNLMGRPAKVEACYRTVLAGSNPVLMGLYDNGQGALALVACDMELAASVAVAMGDLPASQVRECLESGDFCEEHLETLQEFLRVAASLLNTPGMVRLALRSAHVQLRQLPPRAVMLAVKPRIQATFTVEVPGYGAGGMLVSLD